MCVSACFIPIQAVLSITAAQTPSPPPLNLALIIAPIVAVVVIIVIAVVVLYAVSGVKYV